MDNLSRFYIDLATDVNKANAFNLATEVEKKAILSEAGITDTTPLINCAQEELRTMMSVELINHSSQWQGLQDSASNNDNKNNVTRLGRTSAH